MSTILVVEDNNATRKMVRFALEKRGYTILEAADGATALATMATATPVLVLQDLVLPDIDGFELVGRLRRAAGDRRLVVLAFSGYVSLEDEGRIPAAGFDDVIFKPIEPSRLVTIIEGHLGNLTEPVDVFGRGRRLILADDDPAQLKMVRLRLAGLGFDVTVAGDGREALQLARQQKPDIVVSDVLMPIMDGFGLALGLRQDPALAEVPLVLLTSSYLEATDRELAHRLGAQDLVLRTPDLNDLIRSMRKALAGESRAIELTPHQLPAVEQERANRVVQQLERHVVLATNLARRCSALSAELTVLAAMSHAVLQRDDLDKALDEALDACFDAGGVSVGALYLLDTDGGLSARPLGGSAGWTPEDLQTFFGHPERLRAIIASGKMAVLQANGKPEPDVADLLSRTGALSLLVIPLLGRHRPLGALMMAARGRELDPEDWQLFAHGVANQISQALSLAQAFKEQQAAEREAQEQKRRAVESMAAWQALVESAPDYVARVDLQGRISFVNRTAEGIVVDEVLGASWEGMVEPRHRHVMAEALQQVLTQGQSPTCEVMARRAEGPPIWYACHFGPIIQEGSIAGAVIIARDITSRKHTEAQLMLSDRLASMGILAAGIAHEINNPLAAVIANLDLAMEQAEGDVDGSTMADLMGLLRDAREASERVRVIVRDVRVFSRGDEDRRGPVDLHAVLHSTLRLAWNEVRHRARVVTDFADVPPVLGNESRLGQVFLNLIVNAAQAIPEGQVDSNEIRVSIRRGNGDGLVSVTVSDSGAGMSESVLRDLFTPFFTTKPAGLGTGLGLAICQRIVHGLGGQISVESTVGRGTVVTVRLPVA